MFVSRGCLEILKMGVKRCCWRADPVMDAVDAHAMQCNTLLIMSNDLAVCSRSKDDAESQSYLLDRQLLVGDIMSRAPST